VRIVPLAVLLALISTLTADEAPPPSPHLLLSTKLLRRLKRDRERQTVRWAALENRIKTVPDSPERGFELALYYAVTGDDARGKEAIEWATSHACERRQRALIQDWVGAIPPASCAAPASMRDQAFEKIAVGGDAAVIAEITRRQLVPRFAASGITSSADLYAIVELLSVLRAASGDDIRLAASQFFRNLPEEFLLSLKPEQVERPDWMTHVAALALVSLDPNLESSQFLQGWAMEDRQTLREGPGVAYELLWADPYLPGIAYQNLDPWLYEEERGRLFARSGWTLEACWINISPAGLKAMNCPAGWQARPAQFGSMTLAPMISKCLDVQHQEIRQNLIVWKLEPGQGVVYRDKKDVDSRADSSGMWHPGVNVEGKVCRR
jgi:hypothetical protein